jgi:hypothetical protein
MKNKTKNIKISDKHHQMLKNYCEKNGLKIYKVVERWIDNLSKNDRKDIYGE